MIAPQRRLSSAEPSSSNFFSSQPQIPLGTFTNSGPFSRPPNTQQFILNGQQAQFQPVRSPGSLSFSDAVSAVSQPTFFQQAPIQPSQSFNFFPGSSSQQQRFRPIIQQQRAEQQDSVEHFDDRQNPQSSLILQQSSQERFPSDSPRRPLSQTNGIIAGARNPSPVGSSGWWNPETLNGEPVAVNVNSDEESSVGVNVKDDTTEFNQQRPSEQQKRGRGQSQQGKRRPITTPAPSSIHTSEEQQEPASIGFTVVHDGSDNRSSWSQPIITTHRPQLAQTSFRNRNTPAVNPALNRRPTTYNPLSVLSSSTSVRTPPLQPTTSTATLNRIQTSTIRSRKSSLISTTTTTASTLEDEEEEVEEEEPFEERRQFLPRRFSTTTTTTQVPITTLRTPIKPRLNVPVAAVPQQQRMKKIVNNPTIIQSITTKKPILTTTSTLAPTTTTNKEEEYEEYEDVQYTTVPYITTEQSLNKKQTKLSPQTQISTTTMNPKNNDSGVTTTESWFVVANVQTSRSVSSSSSSSSSINKNQTSNTVTLPTNKHRFNNKPTLTTPSATTVESIIDKLDRVQSELSNGILYGSSSNTNNNSRILTDIQNSSNNDDKRNDVVISSFTTPAIEKTTQNVISSTTPTSTSTSSNAPSTTTENEDDDEDKEEEDSDDSEKETTIVRKFIPSKQRTSTVSSIVITSTAKSSTQIGKKKSLIDSVKFDELLTSGLLPAGFNPKPPPAYKSKTITTTTTETSLPTTNNSTSDTTVNTTPSTSSTTVKAKSLDLKIKFVDDSSALASLLPPGFKLEETIKPVETLPPSLLPPGYKLPVENVDPENKNKEQEVISTTVISTTDAPSTTTKIITSSTTGIVFPNNGKGTNNTGTRKPLPSSKKIQASVTVAPVIQKGWPVR